MQRLLILVDLFVVRCLSLAEQVDLFLGKPLDRFLETPRPVPYKEYWEEQYTYTGWLYMAIVSLIVAGPFLCMLPVYAWSAYRDLD